MTIMEENNESFLKSKVIPFVYKHFLMVGILVALVIGFLLPQPGEWVGRFKGSSYICVICVFLHSGLKLRTAEAKSAIKELGAFVWGVVSIMLISSVLGTILTQLLPFGDTLSNSARKNDTGTSDIGPGEFLLGLELYYISPCAISSGIVLVTLAGGDVTLALLLTVTTNTLGVIIVPLLAKWLLTVKNVQVDMVNLLVKLVSTVLVPLLIGKAMTRLNMVKSLVKKHTKTLKIISLIFLICIPWMKISKAQMSGSFNIVSPQSIFFILLWVLAIHFLFLLMNYFVSWILRFKLEVRKTLVVLASMKTLAITLSIISFLPPEFGDPGLMSLPLVISHLVLILVDSVLVVRWNSTEEDPSQDTVTRNQSASITDSEESTTNIVNRITSV